MAAPDVDSGDLSLTTIERLILAQAVYEHGADNWQSVSKVLSTHPALARPAVFSPKSCRQIYHRLMNDASLECSEANNTPHAPVNLRLAQRHYSARLLHLRDLIATEEARFKALVTEIDEIRSGAWDDKIKAKLIGNVTSTTTEALLDSHTPVEPVSPQENTTNDLPSTDDQGTSTQAPEDNIADDVAQQPLTAIIPDTSVDGQVAQSIPVTEDVVIEPVPVEIIGAFEELTTGDIPKTSKPPVSENVQMEVDEPIIPTEPEYKPEEEAQREGKRKIPESDNLDENAREKKRPRDESMPPDIDEQASSSRQRGTTNSEVVQQIPPAVPNKRFQTVIGMLHSQISQHRNGNIFHNPIKNSEAPDYHDIIKRPMDLKTIKARVKDGIISNSLEFQRDVYLMFANAMMYNRPGSDIYHMAEEMMLESEVHINTFRQTEGFIRSTRA